MNRGPELDLESSKRDSAKETQSKKMIDKLITKCIKASTQAPLGSLVLPGPLLWMVGEVIRCHFPQNPTFTLRRLGFEIGPFFGLRN